nr:hypothetical protein DA06_04845 [Georgenia sp. SUBG003]
MRVDGVTPFSATASQKMSSARTAVGSASPRQRTRKRCVAVSTRSTSRWGTAGMSCPRADWATKLIIIAEARARFSRASAWSISGSGR